jgi:putative hydrolase of the HAD superfamily
MLILFDIDDTLLDDTLATRLAMDALHTQLQSEWSLEEFRARWLDSIGRHFPRFLAGEITFEEQRRARIRDVVATELPDSKADDVFATYLVEYERHWRLFADVLPCLDALREHQLGVVSNGNSYQQRQKLQRLGILERFTCVVLSEEAGCAKPDARIFVRACELAGADPRQSVHVGDRLDVDVFGASQAGLNAVWLNRSAAKAPAHDHALTTIGTLAELPTLVCDTV